MEKSVIQTNADFSNHKFYNENKTPFNISPKEVVEKFKQITGIEERRYASDEMNASDIGAIAGMDRGSCWQRKLPLRSGRYVGCRWNGKVSQGVSTGYRLSSCLVSCSPV